VFLNNKSEKKFTLEKKETYSLTATLGSKMILKRILIAVVEGGAGFEWNSYLKVLS